MDVNQIIFRRGFSGRLKLVYCKWRAGGREVGKLGNREIGKLGDGTLQTLGHLHEIPSLEGQGWVIYGKGLKGGAGRREGEMGR
jgi:hypothetical protein